MATNKKDKKFLNSVIEKLNTHDECEIDIANQEVEITKDIFNIFRFEDNQEELIKQLEETNYSIDNISEIKKIFMNYDSTSVTFNTARTIIDAQKHICEAQEYEDNIRNTIISRIANKLFK